VYVLPAPREWVIYHWPMASLVERPKCGNRSPSNYWTNIGKIRTHQFQTERRYVHQQVAHASAYNMSAGGTCISLQYISRQHMLQLIICQQAAHAPAYNMSAGGTCTSLQYVSRGHMHQLTICQQGAHASAYNMSADCICISLKHVSRWHLHHLIICLQAEYASAYNMSAGCVSL
jgi:hypothetical protein